MKLEMYLDADKTIVEVKEACESIWSLQKQKTGPEGTSPLSLKLHTKPITTLALFRVIWLPT